MRHRGAGVRAACGGGEAEKRTFFFVFLFLFLKKDLVLIILFLTARAWYHIPGNSWYSCIVPHREGIIMPRAGLRAGKERELKRSCYYYFMSHCSCPVSYTRARYHVSGNSCY